MKLSLLVDSENRKTLKVDLKTLVSIVLSNLLAQQETLQTFYNCHMVAPRYT